MNYIFKSTLFKKTLLMAFAAAIYLVCVQSALSEDNSIRIVEIDSSRLEDDYDNAMESDRLEGFNRTIFSFNKAIDDYFLAPVARGYRYVLPVWGRNRVTDFFNNMEEPRNFVNSLLQGDVEGAFRSFWRAVINSTFGIGGLHDVASGFGLGEKDKYFSQTLGVYGINAGDYLMLPLFGSSTYRDFGGQIFDLFTKPTTYIESTGVVIALNAGEIISKRERLLDVSDNLENDSFDLYSTYKSGYLQNRKNNLIETAE